MLFPAENRKFFAVGQRSSLKEAYNTTEKVLQDLYEPLYGFRNQEDIDNEALKRFRYVL